MKNIFALLVFLSLISLSRSEESPAILNYQIIALRPDGFGQRVLIPFNGHIENGGLRLWECIAEPFYAQGEDITLRKDINLFSLCKIKIFANRPEQNPAKLIIDFSGMTIPKGVVIPKKDIVDALFYCIVKTSFVHTLEKPEIELKLPADDKEVFISSKEVYDSPDFGHVKGDKGHSTSNINQENPPN
jgi:hypothetical protein